MPAPDRHDHACSIPAEYPLAASPGRGDGAADLRIHWVHRQCVHLHEDVAAGGHGPGRVYVEEGIGPFRPGRAVGKRWRALLLGMSGAPWVRCHRDCKHNGDCPSNANTYAPQAPSAVRWMTLELLRKALSCRAASPC